MKAKTLTDVPIRIRPATEEDVPFIFSSWLKSYRASMWAKQINNTIFYSEHHKVIEELLKSCQVFVACNDKDTSDLYGYICAEKVDGVFVLHYLYIKHTYRLLGLGSLLLNQFEHNPATASLCTHLTRIGERLSAKYSMVYSPYIALTKQYRTKEIK